MNEFEELFLNTIKDIEKRLSSSDPYEILMISGLLRKLFLDSYPLVDRVNKEHKLKIEFEIVDRSRKMPYEKDIVFWSIQDGLFPETAPSFRKRIVVSRDKFFNTIVAKTKNEEFSVKDVIKFKANVCGGIHADSPKSEKDEILQRISKYISIGGYESNLRQLKAIARVILKSLEPLCQIIKT